MSPRGEDVGSVHTASFSHFVHKARTMAHVLRRKNIQINSFGSVKQYKLKICQIY